jgi:hypothetical protein
MTFEKNPLTPKRSYHLWVPFFPGAFLFSGNILEIKEGFFLGQWPGDFDQLALLQAGQTYRVQIEDGEERFVETVCLLDDWGEEPPALKLSWQGESPLR